MCARQLTRTKDEDDDAVADGVGHEFDLARAVGVLAAADLDTQNGDRRIDPVLLRAAREGRGHGLQPPATARLSGRRPGGRWAPAWLADAAEECGPPASNSEARDVGAWKGGGRYVVVRCTTHFGVFVPQSLPISRRSTSHAVHQPMPSPTLGSSHGVDLLLQLRRMDAPDV